METTSWSHGNGKHSVNEPRTSGSFGEGNGVIELRFRIDLVVTLPFGVGSRSEAVGEEAEEAHTGAVEAEVFGICLTRFVVQPAPDVIGKVAFDLCLATALG
jgi:hypothetical protein